MACVVDRLPGKPPTYGVIAIVYYLRLVPQLNYAWLSFQVLGASCLPQFKGNSRLCGQFVHSAASG